MSRTGVIIILVVVRGSPPYHSHNISYTCQPPTRGFLHFSSPTPLCRRCDDGLGRTERNRCISKLFRDIRAFKTYLNSRRPCGWCRAFRCTLRHVRIQIHFFKSPIPHREIEHTHRDDTYFRQVTRPSALPSDNWVLRFGTLKRLYRLMTQYSSEVLHKPTSSLDVPDLQAIAKDSNLTAILILCRLTIVIGVQCDQNREFIDKIQQLSETDQHHLMKAIEQVSVLHVHGFR